MSGDDEYVLTLEDASFEDIISHLQECGYTREDIIEQMEGETLRDTRWIELFDWIKENKSLDEMNDLLNVKF